MQIAGRDANLLARTARLLARVVHLPEDRALTALIDQIVQMDPTAPTVIRVSPMTFTSMISIPVC